MIIFAKKSLFLKLQLVVGGELKTNNPVRTSKKCLKFTCSRCYIYYHGFLSISRSVWRDINELRSRRFARRYERERNERILIPITAIMIL